MEVMASMLRTRKFLHYKKLSNLSMLYGYSSDSHGRAPLMKIQETTFSQNRCKGKCFLRQGTIWDDLFFFDLWSLQFCILDFHLHSMVTVTAYH